MSKPLIYIAALRRTGSTLLSEVLTSPPDAYVFREPRLPMGLFRPKQNDIAFFQEHGVDLSALQDEMAEAPRRKRVALFQGKVFPELSRVVCQIGVKEIHHRGWETVWDAFPRMRVILTARDPRDIFISMHAKYVDPNRRLGWKGPLTPERVAEDLQEDFRHQLAMARRTESLKVRYEDLCTEPSVLSSIRSFVGNSGSGVGMTGRLSRKDHNHRIHANQISERRVNRWQDASPELLRLAQKTLNLMPEYRDFWGY
jgi:hypothetical protein